MELVYDANSGGEVSLEEAIRQKYCPPVDYSDVASDSFLGAGTNRSITQTALKYKPGGCPVHRRSSIVLDHSKVSGVEGGEELGQLCENVEEMILSGNEIKQWSHVCNILSTVPKLSFLDVSHNEIDSSSVSEVAERGVAFHQVKTLVLNCTHLQWTAVQECLKMLPNLEELHLSNNNYSTVDFDPSFSHSSISRLHFNNNTISKWEEFTKLSSAFPNLSKLVAGSLPLSTIPEQNCEVFPSLNSLYLNDSTLNDWSSIEQLSALPKLSDLSVLNLPLCRRMKEKERRFAVIGRLANLQSLNKSSITETEREDAERWLIRQYMDVATPPPIYHDLIQKHGIVNKLAEVDLRPEVTAEVEFHFQGSHEMKTINITQTLKQFKQWLSEEVVGVPPSSILVYHLDPELNFGMDLLRYDSRFLYSYRIKDGNKIYIELKQSARNRRQS